MSNYPALINFDGMQQFKIKNGETYTVPNVLQVSSPTNASSGVFPTTAFDSKREVVHALLYAAFNDAAGPADLGFPGLNLRAGDVVVLSAVVSNVITVTVNGVQVYAITGVTTTGGLLGCLS